MRAAAVAARIRAVPTPPPIPQWSVPAITPPPAPSFDRSLVSRAISALRENWIGVIVIHMTRQVLSRREDLRARQIIVPRLPTLPAFDVTIDQTRSPPEPPALNEKAIRWALTARRRRRAREAAATEIRTERSPRTRTPTEMVNRFAVAMAAAEKLPPAKRIDVLTRNTSRAAALWLDPETKEVLSQPGYRRLAQMAERAAATVSANPKNGGSAPTPASAVGRLPRDTRQQKG